MPAPTFSQYLLQKYATDFEKATQNPFLVESGQLSIDEKVLCKWLRQDYLYAFVGYIKFASTLLSRIPIPSTPPHTSTPQTTYQKALTKSVPLLTFSLSNVVRESNFFLETAKEYGLDANFWDTGNGTDTEGALLGGYEDITRSYVDFLGGIGGVEEGLVVLWAMEKAYFTAWNFAKTHLPTSTTNLTPKQQALLKFIDNWTNDEFAGFVNDCEEVFDGLGVEPGTPVGERCEEAFKRCIWLEQRFWPAV